MEAEMARAGLIRDWRRPSAIGGTVAVAILMIASLAQGQAANFHGQPLAETGARYGSIELRTPHMMQDLVVSPISPRKLHRL